MKKSVLLILALPLLLTSCDFLGNQNGGTQSSSQQTTETGGNTQGQTGGNTQGQTGGQTGQGTEGSGTGSSTEGGTHSGGHHSGGGSTGGGTETDGGTGSGSGEQTGGGSGTGGGTSGGGGSQTTTSTTITKAIIDFGFVNQKDVTDFDMATDLHVSCSKGGNTQNTPKYYSNDAAIRLYGKNTITFSSDKTITKICFTFSSEDKGNNLNPSTGTISKDRKTWTGSTNSVTFTIDGSSGKACINTISVTYEGNGESIGGGTTGGGTSGGGQTGGESQTGGGTSGGGTISTTDYTSTWPSQYQQYVVTYLNGMVPCFLDVNKNCLFNGFATSTEGSTGLPYFNPYIKNTSPGINYEYNYGGILRDAGFKEQESEQEDGITWKIYTKGTCYVRFSKHKGTDNIYYFDMYAFNDYKNTTLFNNAYTFQHDDKSLALTSKYEQNNKTVNVNGWKITLTDIQKNSYYMQLRKDTGKIVIEGDVKGIYLEILRNSDAAFIKAGTSKSTANYIFNNGYRFDFPSGTKYVEISAQSRVLEFELFEVGY